jgi:hypothetical protein
MQARCPSVQPGRQARPIINRGAPSPPAEVPWHPALHYQIRNATATASADFPKLYNNL